MDTETIVYMHNCFGCGDLIDSEADRFTTITQVNNKKQYWHHNCRVIENRSAEDNTPQIKRLLDKVRFFNKFTVA